MQNRPEMLSGGDFNLIRAFVAVATSLSFSKAAVELGVSPSALSRLVRTLEARLDRRLLNRTTRSVALTPAGEAFYASVLPSVTALGGVLSRARSEPREPAGTLRIHGFRRSGDLFLAPALRAFGDAFPAVTLDITLDDAVVDFVGAGFDAAIRIGDVVDGDMQSFRLGPDMRQIVVASPEYLARCGTPAVPEDVRGHACIRWRWDGNDLPEAWEFSRNGRTFGIVVDGTLVVNSRDLELRAAIDGLGLAQVVEDRATPYLAQGRLTALLPEWSVTVAGYHLCYPRQRHESPALQAFVDFMRARHPHQAADDRRAP